MIFLVAITVASAAVLGGAAIWLRGRNLRPIAKRIDEGKAAELRTRWLAQRLYYYGKIEVTFEEFSSEDSRVQELFSPLVVMAQIFGGREFCPREQELRP